MKSNARIATVLLAPALLLSACGGNTADDAGNAGTDAALNDEIMVDPDLAGQNAANSALSVPPTGTLPATAMTPEAIATARSAALKLVGGPGKMKKAPEAQEVSGSLANDAALAVAARAAAAPGANAACVDKAEYTTGWAARLPETFPVYPSGAVQEAAGTDEGNCALRVVNFLSGVPLSEVIDFYYTRAANAGFTAQHANDGEYNIIGGAKGGESFIVYARSLGDGSTEVELITGGA